MNAQRIHKIQYAYPDAPKPIHPDKEQIRSQTIQLGTNIQIPTAPTFPGTALLTFETQFSL
jgi:hypothetical protein